MKRLKLVLATVLTFGMSATVMAQLEPITGTMDERLDSIETQMRAINSKAGIHFGGRFHSRVLSSALSGNVTEHRNYNEHESLMFTGVDLGLTVRPVDVISGTAIIRMHHDWRNMFGATANPLTLRWISVDGNARNLFQYNLGDFRQRYTPLTLWTPEPNIMFEPTVFARQRQFVMQEEFLGNNNRVLQGANFNFGAVVAPALQELRIGAFATRLRMAERERPELTGGSPIQVATTRNLFDRYAAGVNTDMVFIPGTRFGGTFMYIGDAMGTAMRGPNDIGSWREATSNMVFSGRAGVGSELIGSIDPRVARFSLSAEFAGSNYRYWSGPGGTGTPSGWGAMTDSQRRNAFTRDTLGTAIRAGFDGDFRFAAAGLSVNANFIANHRYFRNELAQSPAMFNRAVLNSDNPHFFNSFDNMYVSAFTYMPGEGHRGTKQPMRKGSFTRTTLTTAELERALAQGDTASVPFIEQLISGAMHFGEATPNRTGIVADLSADFADRAILVQGGVKVLEEISGIGNNQEFMEFGGGLSLDVARFGNWWAHPLILSGSFRQTTVDNFRGQRAATNDISFANAGVYWQFWRRAALMGGYQFLRNNAMPSAATRSTEVTTQQQWAAGFEFLIAEGGVLNATVGQVMVDHTTNDSGSEWWGNAETGTFWNNSRALRFDLNLTVNF